MIDACNEAPAPRERRPPWRALVLLCATALGVAACSSDATGPGGSNPDPESNNPEPYDHTLAPGASAHDLLSSQDYDSLVAEVQYLDGFRPTDGGLALFEAFLGDRVHKPAGIEIRILPALHFPSQATYSVADVQGLEREHRTAETAGRTLTIYFLFLNGEYSEQANVLGFAYNNTSMAIFEEKIRDNSGGALQPSQSTVEGIVLSHEMGHNLGLVANGSPMQVEHEDEANGPHCDNDGCLMYYAVRTTDFIANLTGDAPVLDQNCIDDLRANGGK